MSSQNIIGYSDFFTLGTPTHEYPNISGYSGVFEMNMMGEYFSGYSGFFVMNTVGGIIYGQITANETGLPIQGAIVKSLTYASSPSDQQGMYKLYVPFGYGYKVSAFASNYEDKSADNIHLPYGNPIKLLNFQLSPGELTLSLSAIQPNPNPAISTVQQGGTFHRYYKVTNSTNGSPRSMIPVRVTAGMFSETYLSDEDGIVDISINSNRIGQGQPGEQADFAIVSVNNVVLAEPVPFTGKIINSEYGKYWDSYTFGKLGLSFFKIDGKNGSSIKILENNSSNQTTDNLEIARQAERKAGIEFGVGVELGAVCGPVRVGENAKAGVGGNVAIITEDEFKFGRVPASNDYEAIGRYVLMANGSFHFLDETLYVLLMLGEINFNNQYNMLDAFQGSKKAIDLGMYGKADAAIGIGSVQSLGVGIETNLGAEAHVKLDFSYNYADGEKEVATEFSGKFSAADKAGLNMDLSGGYQFLKEVELQIEPYNRDFDRGIRFVFVRDLTKQSEPLKKVKLTFIKRNIINKTGFEEEMSYTLSGEELIEAITNIQSIDLIEKLNNLPNGGIIKIASGVYKHLLTEIFNICNNLQTNSQGEASIDFVKEHISVQHQENVEISIKGQYLVSGLKAEIGGGRGFEEGSFYTKEKGKWISGKHFVLEENDGIGPFNDNLENLMQDVVDDLPQWLKNMIGVVDWLTFWNKNKTVFYVGDAGSFIEINPSAIPPGLDSLSCTSWAWYGNSPATKRNNLSESNQKFVDNFRVKAENSFGMRYGIGGFYQFEPYGTELLDTCWMTIVYSQEEVDSLDESSLGMYWEDKANHRWVYIGGVLDTTNNMVTAPITQLSLFTLAPAMPFGAFGLNAVPDSIYADSISVATVLSDTIFNNNLRPVNDGEKFTVATTNGKILTADADTAIDGIQVVAANHQIQFEIRSSHIGGTATVSAFSVNGSATASTNIRFYDTIPPAPPVLVEAIPDSTTTNLSWLPNSEDDLSGYVLYFDTDTIHPFEGIHTVYGQPSPIYTGTDTTRMVYGLFNDTTYYFTLTSVDVEGNESGYSNFIAAKPFTLSSQKIQLPQGWSGLSTYLTPSTDNIEPLFDPILSDLIILQNTSGIYWPGQNINTLGAWNTHDGYQIKVANAVELNISGTRENNKTLQLSAGWNLIPVLSECEVDVETLFAGKDVIIVKEVAGWNIYWPEFGINSLGVLKPGKAYFVLMGSAGTIEFPVCGGLKVGFENLTVSPDLSAFKISTTPITHTIAIPAQFGSALNEGDIISIYDKNGNCFGVIDWQSQTTAITIFGDDPTTNIKDGFSENEPLDFRLYRHNIDKEFEMEVTFNPAMPNPERIFNGNGLSVITEMKLLPVGISSLEPGSEVLIIPNPAKDEFTLVIGDHTFEKGVLTIYTIDGRFVKTENIDVNHTKINISEMRSGVYLLKIEYGNKTVNKRLLKK